MKKLAIITLMAFTCHGNHSISKKIDGDVATYTIKGESLDKTFSYNTMSKEYVFSILKKYINRGLLIMNWRNLLVLKKI